MGKNINFTISILSPLLPLLAMVIFNKITQALPLLIACILILVLILWSVVALVRTKETSSALKILGTVLGVIGLFITVLFGILSALTIPKI